MTRASADESLSEEIIKKVFSNDSTQVINEAAKQLDCEAYEVVVTFHKNKLRYFDTKKSQWITFTEIPGKVCSKKKVCSIKDRIYIIGSDVNDDLEWGWLHVAEYNARTKSWRTFPSASLEPVRENRFDWSEDNTFSVGFLCSVGNKLYIRSSWIN